MDDTTSLSVIRINSRLAELEIRITDLELELSRVRLTADQADNVAALARDRAFDHYHHRGDIL